MCMEANWGVFIATITVHILILVSHVDDCTITRDSPSLIKAFKDEIGTHFQITDLGLISWLLGMKVTRNRVTHTISLSQKSYINAILTKYNFSDVKPVSIPLDPYVHLSKKQSPKTTSKIIQIHNIPYWQAVSSLIHLASGTCPDIAFTTSFVAQFCANPGWDHWEAVKQIYRYLTGTKVLVLTFGTRTTGLIGYVDADGATQEHHCAITGYAFLINGRAVLWGLRKQELVTLSMAESEYICCHNVHS